VAGVSALALAIGPVVGGFLAEDVSWRAIFFLNLPVAAGAVAITLFATAESRDETVPASSTSRDRHAHRRPHALVLALVEATPGTGLRPDRRAVRDRDRRPDRVRRRRAARRYPMVDFSFFRARSFLGANITAFIVTFSMFAMFFFSRSTCRTSSGTRRSRRACGSCRRRS